MSGNEKGAKHTPWNVNGSESTTAIWVEDASGQRVCTMRNCEDDADRAALIASAPALLAALKGISESMRKALPHLPADSTAIHCGEWLDEANAAINQAEGK